MAVVIDGSNSGCGEPSTMKARFSIYWCNDGATRTWPWNSFENCSRSKVSRLTLVT